MKPSYFKFFLVMGALLSFACVPPKYIPADLHQLKSTEDLGLKSQEAYEKARNGGVKKEKLKWAQAGIAYSEKCLKTESEKPLCLYYNVLNRGIFIKNHIPDYQKSLRVMVAHCQTLINVDPSYKNAGCYRVLGNIYSQAPGFSLNPKNITQDMEKAKDYLLEAVKLAPDYALNHLFYGRCLLSLNDVQAAEQQLKEFDHLRTPSLDKAYPQWKEDREKLAQELQNKLK